MQKPTAPDRGLGAGLFMVATPIGAARDITLRALDILATADIVAAEDTRTARKLMELHGIASGGRPFLAYHDHNGAEMRPRILRALEEGQSVAYVSEAGTPMVADPGYQLVRAVVAAGHQVWTAPGASAALAALVASGLPSDRFLFAGFPRGRGEKLKNWLADQAAFKTTVILYESAKRVHGMLGLLEETFGRDTQMALCRELTKRHEEVVRGSISEVMASIADRTLKGEIVLVVGAPVEIPPAATDVENALRAVLRKHKVKDAAAMVAAKFGLPRREVYQLALGLDSEDKT